MYDIIVIGAGVTGTCTARELSKYQVNMCVIDKGDDVASGHPKQTVVLFMVDMTVNQELLWQR